MSSWTSRGTGSCPKCSEVFSTRWKPENCAKCDFPLGGVRQPSTKKKKMNCPNAVLISQTVKETIYSVKTSTRDDRCIVVQKDGSFFCAHEGCKTSRATFLSSNLSFQCLHTEKCKHAVAPEIIYELSSKTIDEYNGDNSAKEILLAIEQSRLPHSPVVCKVSDLSYVVLGSSSTNNTTGYSHVKYNKGNFVCRSKDSKCKGYVAKGKYERASRFCSHLHALFCVGVKPTSPPVDCVNDDSQLTVEPSTSACSSTSESVPSMPCSNYSLQRSNTLKLHSSRNTTRIAEGNRCT